MVTMLLFGVSLLFAINTSSGNTKNKETLKDSLTVLINNSRQEINVNPVNARIMAKKGLKLTKSKKFELQQASLNQVIGISYSMTSNFDSASHYMYKALNTFELFKDYDKVFEARMGIGNLYYMAYDYDKALELWEESLVYYKSIKDSTQIGMLYYNIANVAYLKNEFNRAKKTYRMVDTYIPSLSKETDFLGKLLHAKALNYLKMGQLDVALSNGYKSLDIALYKNDTYGLNQLYVFFGETYLKLGELDSAEMFLLKALEIDLLVNNAELSIPMYKHLSKVYELKGEINLALSYFSKYVKLKENYIPEGFKERFKEKENSYLTEIARLRLIEISSLKDQTLKAELQSRNYLIGILGIILLSSIVIIFLLSRKNKVVKQYAKAKAKFYEEQQFLLKERLERKNKELISKVLFLSKQSKVINNMYLKLKKIHEGVYNSGDVATLLSEIKISQLEHSWKEFEKLFVEINKKFYPSLLAKYPNLSKNERRLCAFLKLGLSTKEIAQITFQSERAINVSRYRLRTKMGLIKEESLGVEIFQQIG